MQPQELARHLRPWLQERHGLFALHELPDGILLTEISSGKSLRLGAEVVLDIALQRDWTNGAEYLHLALADRPALALADVGFVFALDPRHTGPLAGAPPAMSFADYQRLQRHLLHLLDALDDPHRRREALDITMVLIASLDGARAVGLAVDEEERALESAIRRLDAAG